MIQGNPEQPPKFLVYCTYHDTGDAGGLGYFHADDPFEAHVQHCMQFAKVPRWQACCYLEDEAWTGNVLRVTGPYSAEIIFWKDMNYPWNRRTALDRQIKQLQEAMPLVQQFATLQTLLPDLQLGDVATALDTLRQRLADAQTALAELQNWWLLQRTEPSQQESGREHRAIQIIDTIDPNKLVNEA